MIFSKNICFIKNEMLINFQFLSKNVYFSKLSLKYRHYWFFWKYLTFWEIEQFASKIG